MSAVGNINWESPWLWRMLNRIQTRKWKRFSGTNHKELSGWEIDLGYISCTITKCVWKGKKNHWRPEICDSEGHLLYQGGVHEDLGDAKEDVLEAANTITTRMLDAIAKLQKLHVKPVKKHD